MISNRIGFVFASCERRAKIGSTREEKVVARQLARATIKMGGGWEGCKAGDRHGLVIWRPSVSSKIHLLLFKRLGHSLSSARPTFSALNQQPAMFPSQARLGGLLWYSPLRNSPLLFLLADSPLTARRKRNRVMSEAQKANARKRLKDVDAVIEAVRLSGVSCKALVRYLAFSSGRARDKERGCGRQGRDVVGASSSGEHLGADTPYLSILCCSLY